MVSNRKLFNISLNYFNILLRQGKDLSINVSMLQRLRTKPNRLLDSKLESKKVLRTFIVLMCFKFEKKRYLNKISLMLKSTLLIVA